MLYLTSNCLSKEETKICLSEQIEHYTEDGSTLNVRLKYTLVLTHKREMNTTIWELYGYLKENIEH